MVTWCGPGNIYQTFHDFGLVLWLFFLPCGDVECCIDPPFCQAVLASFHCLCFSGTVYQMAWWFFAEHKELALGNFLLYPKIHCVSLKIRYSLPTGWVFSIFNVFPFFCGVVVWVMFYTKRHTIYSFFVLSPVETCTHIFGVSLAVALIDFPSDENACDLVHLETLKEKSSLKQEGLNPLHVQTRQWGLRENRVIESRPNS